MNFQEITPMEGETEPTTYIVHQVNCPQLAANPNQNLILCGACMESARYKVSGQSLQCNGIYR
jgi:hypothetical protein